VAPTPGANRLLKGDRPTVAWPTEIFLTSGVGRFTSSQSVVYGHGGPVRPHRIQPPPLIPDLFAESVHKGVQHWHHGRVDRREEPRVLYGIPESRCAIVFSPSASHTY
jgi:hypothetical protein